MPKIPVPTKQFENKKVNKTLQSLTVALFLGNDMELDEVDPKVAHVFEFRADGQHKLRVVGRKLLDDRVGRHPAPNKQTERPERADEFESAT